MTRLVIDPRRDLEVAGGKEETIRFAITHFIACAQAAIRERGLFSVALSGGSTPRSIFEGLASEEFRDQIDWKKVALFWSDERCVTADDKDSNYRMAMEAGFANLVIPKGQIHRLEGDAPDLDKVAMEYQEKIVSLPGKKIDLVMLGMGDDGHTASLFPHTEALHIEDRLVVPNFIPQKNCWRLTLTYPGIQSSRHIALYVIGAGKAEMLHSILQGPYTPDNLPAQRVGESSHRALWIADKDAASKLVS
jgi:6-phosphogluconolactonase